tara:strand:- start:617 stop:1219 length:603 start_codon:yes stop_codon:yes gene_type:complete
MSKISIAKLALHVLREEEKKYRDLPPYQRPLNDGICSCWDLDHFLEASSDPEKISAIFAASSLIDQFIHYRYDGFAIHKKFDDEFQFLKLRAHGGNGCASPDLFFKIANGKRELECSFSSLKFWSLYEKYLFMFLGALEEYFEDFDVRYDTKCSEALVASLTIEIDAEFEGEDLIKVQRIIKNYFGPKHSKLKELQEASL